MIKKNIFKLTITSIIVLMLSFLVYRNYVYYLIPYNPLKEYYNTTPYSVNYILYTDENPSGYHINTDQNNTEYNDEIIFEYFRNLKLVPLSRNEFKMERSLVESTDRVWYSFEFEDYGTLYINDIFLDNLSVIRISGDNIPQYHEGYFKIVDGEVDYNYISKLIKGEKD